MRPDIYGEQRVVCLRREVLEEAGRFQGVSLEWKRYLARIGNPDNYHFLPRAEAESDVRYKQIISYVLIVRGNCILRYQRGKQSGERRLRGCYSIGVGGHIDKRDCCYCRGGGYETAVLRELVEETGMELYRMPPVIGVINDDSDEVGKVHFGVVHLLEIGETRGVSRGSELSSPEFIRLADARQNLDRYETWSQWCLQKILIPDLGKQLDKMCITDKTTYRKILLKYEERT